MRTLASVLMLVAMLSSSQAQQQDCSKVLNPQLLSVTKAAADWEVESTFIETVDEQTYDQMQKSGKLNVIIKQVPIGFSYAEAKEYIKNLRSQTEQHYTNNGRMEYYAATLSPVALEIYRACITGNPRQLLSVWIEEATQTNVKVSYKLRAGEVEFANFQRLSITHRGVELRQQPALFPSSGEVHSLTVPRNDQQEIVLNFQLTMRAGSQNVSNETSLVIPWVPRLDTTREEIRRSSDDADLKVNDTSRIWYAVERPIPDGSVVNFQFGRRPGYYIDPSSITFTPIAWEKGSCTLTAHLVDINNKRTGKLQEITASRISGRLWYWAQNHNNCNSYAMGRLEWIEYRNKYTVRK
jgi:hypothetical protein